MNKPDNPRRLNAEGNWTSFVESLANPTAKSDVEERIGKMTKSDLSPGHIDDLELDSMIRELAKSEIEEQAFVGKVLGKLDLPNSHPVPRKKGKLPVPAPVFEVDPCEETQAHTEHFVSRLLNSPWITPKSLVIASSITAALAIAYFVTGLETPPNSSLAKSDIGSSAMSDALDNSSTDLATSPLASELTDEPEKIAADGLASNAPPNDGSLQDSTTAPAIQGKVNEVVEKQPGLRPIQRWNFSIDFDEYGLGKMQVNDNNLPGLVFRDSSFPLLDNIGEVVKLRFETLQPRLGTQIGGTISINGKDFRFGNADRIDTAISRAMQFAASLPAKTMNRDQYMKRRAKYLRDQEFRSFMAAGDKRSASFNSATSYISQLAPGLITTRDEAASLKAVVQATDEFLRDWSNQIVEWETDTNQSPSLANNGLSEKDFDEFRLNGKMLAVKSPRVRSSQTIQKLNEEELRFQLAENTRALNIFKDNNEFKEAAAFVSKNDNRGVSQKSEKLSKQLASIESRLATLAQKPSLENEDRQRITQLENQYVEIADRLESFRRDNGVEPLLDFLAERPELKGLPLVMGDECHMEPSQAKSMSLVSKSVGATLAKFDRFATRDANQNDSFRFNLVRNDMAAYSKNYSDDNALVTLDQMLQIDHPRVRGELVKALSKSKSEKSMELLARRAKFDFVPEVRLASAEALAKFPAESYRHYLLDGFQYPWAVVAEHSAEAIVRLDDKGALDGLVALLKSPDPRLPQKADNGKYFQNEVVAINHMKNCMLCHAPSTGQSDRGRAVVPRWNEPLPRLYYNHPTGGSFVRADTTYLRQDFSVMQPVEDHGHWPKIQRFDYVTFRNELSNEQARDFFRDHQNDENRHRKAVLFALRQLTGLNPSDDSHATWVAAVANFKKSLDQR